MMLHSFSHTGRIDFFSKELFVSQNKENSIEDVVLEQLYDRVVQNEMKVVGDDFERVQIALRNERSLMTHKQYTLLQRKRADEERRRMTVMMGINVKRQLDDEEKLEMKKLNINLRRSHGEDIISDSRGDFGNENNDGYSDGDNDDEDDHDGDNDVELLVEESPRFDENKEKSQINIDKKVHENVFADNDMDLFEKLVTKSKTGEEVRKPELKAESTPLSSHSSSPLPSPSPSIISSLPSVYQSIDAIPNIHAHILLLYILPSIVESLSFFLLSSNSSNSNITNSDQLPVQSSSQYPRLLSPASLSLPINSTKMTSESLLSSSSNSIQTQKYDSALLSLRYCFYLCELFKFPLLLEKCVSILCPLYLLYSSSSAYSSFSFSLRLLNNNFSSTILIPFNNPSFPFLFSYKDLMCFQTFLQLIGFYYNLFIDLFFFFFYL
jgi:hypothetical protein